MTEAGSALVADTHVVVWYLQDAPQLSPLATEMLDSAVTADDPIFVSGASLVELRYLVEKGVISDADFRRYLVTLSGPGTGFEVSPVGTDVARAVELVTRDVVPDPFDRMIAATSLVLGVPLLTADRKLHKVAAVDAIW